MHLSIFAPLEALLPIQQSQARSNETDRLAMHELTQIIQDATAAIQAEYFTFPVHGSEPVYLCHANSATEVSPAPGCRIS